MILVVGYGPEGEEDHSAAATAANRLDGRSVGDHEVAGSVIPANASAASRAVPDLLEAHEPAAALGVGEVPGHAAVGVERIGFDVDAKLAPVEDDEPEPPDPGYFASLPVDRTVDQLTGQDIPARLAVGEGPARNCHLLYALGRTVEQEELDTVVGCLHLPPSPEAVLDRAADGADGARLQPSLPREVTAKAVAYAGVTAARSR